LSQPEFTFSRTQVITFDPLYTCMDFAARVAVTCMDSLATYGGCCELLIMYGGYSLIAARVLLVGWPDSRHGRVALRCGLRSSRLNINAVAAAFDTIVAGFAAIMDYFESAIDSFGNNRRTTSPP
jgi:hypothetical protein